MSVSNGGGRIERLMARDGTMYLYCVEYCIRPTYLKISRLVYFKFIVLYIWDQWDYMMYVLWTGALRPMLVSWICFVWSMCRHLFL